MIKLIIKCILFIVSFILTLPLMIITWIEAVLTGKKSERIYSLCKEILACIPTFIGQYLRMAYYKATCTHIGFDVCLLLGSMIAHRDTVIRRGTIVGVYSTIGYADIGENVIIGARASVISGKYQHGRPEERTGDKAVKEQYTKITIGANSWIGEGAIILADVGENCTIAAGSVLLKEATADSTFMGNPARKVSLDKS